MPTIQIAQGSDNEGNQWTFEADINASDRPTTLRCINNTSEAAWGQMTQVATGRTHGMRFAPGTTEIAIPTGPAQRLQYTYNAERNRFDGIDTLVVWPYP